MLNLFKNVIYHNVMDFFLPQSCLICKQYIQYTQSNPICFDCYKNIKWISNPRCKSCCSKFQEDMLIDDNCLNCMNEQYSFKHIIACAEYDEYSGKIAMALKYKALASNYIAQCIVKENFNIIKQMHYCIPVPLHINRLFKRGYNQSMILCKSINKLIKIPILNNLLIRTKKTKSQAGLSQKARKNNLKNAFIINPYFPKIELDQIYCKNILLVDDVITTSATIESAANVLKKELGCNVYAACWAKRVI